MYVITSRLCEHSNIVRFEKRAVKTPQHGLRYGNIRYLNIKHEWALTPSTFMLICNERYRRTQEREPAHTGWCTAIQRYQIYRYFEIGPRQNWFIFRFRWRCSLWWSTDLCGQNSFITFWLFVFFLSLYVDLTSHFSNFADFRQLQIPHALTKYYKILPAHNKTPYKTIHKIANRYFEFKYHFSTLQKNSDYFWTRVYVFLCRYAPISVSQTLRFGNCLLINSSSYVYLCRCSALL